MKGLSFEKWEGLGNDFVIVEREPSLDEVRLLCDRRRGVGGDGVLWVQRGDGAPSMVVFNADGSRPEMCGNGLRCVAAYLLLSPLRGELIDTGAGDPDRSELVVHTDAGDRSCRVERRGAATDVIVEMGSVRFEGEERFEVDGRACSFARANIGNPHAITFDAVAPAHHAEIGSRVERATEGGTNVEIVREVEGVFDVVVWERGVGFTQACGTGACALAAVACRQGRARYGEGIRVRLPGGELLIEVEGSNDADRTGQIRMKGPARRVFRGVWVG